MTQSPPCSVCGAEIDAVRFKRYAHLNIQTCSRPCAQEHARRTTAESIRRRNARQRARNLATGYKRTGRPPEERDKLLARQQQHAAVEARRAVLPVNAKK